MIFPQGTKITITGDLGSGKSAVSKILCARTGFNYVSTGQIQRRLAEEMGLDTLEMNRLADVDPSIDEKIDGIFINLGDSPENYVVDSRMAWFFLPNSFKVYLKTALEVAVNRIINDPGRTNEVYESRDEAIRKIAARKQSENDRFLKKYGADCTNMANFDLVIDTANRRPEDVYAFIIKGLESKINGQTFPSLI
ncbi:MAG: cytidylate kinase family protein [Lewinellaceae bacterium]|nr:cytidylate kinase family protein [Saprospiraceae bacterium]MCB9330362.1 cytidylate kinase family protein [Lewinellaceae bacterium]